MKDQNIQIVKEYIEQVFNQKRIERIFDYIAEECIFHSPPYVGIGLIPDSTSGERIVIQEIARGGPADGKLQIGDVITRARDANGDWQTFDELHLRLWGQGKLGAPVTLTVLRGDKELEYTIMRGRIEGFDNKAEDTIWMWEEYLTKEFPDLTCEINLIFGEGDQVAYFATNTGTNSTFHQTVIWTECNILRLEKGRIVEWWGVEDTQSQMLQEGFRLLEPVKEAV
jgi:predicted ester cyclase